MTTEQETTLREALGAAYPAAEPSDALRRRVAALAAEAAAVRVPHQARRIGLGLLGAAATVLLVAALLLAPHLTAVQAYQRMTDSLRDVRSAHYIVWNIQPDGKRVKSSEVWYQAGQWRTENVSGEGKWRETQTQVCQSGKRWTYDENANTVTLDQKTFPEGMETSGFSLTAGLRDQAAHGQKTQVRLLGVTTVQGRPAHVILLYSQWVYDKAEPYARSQIVVDDATDLPIRTESQRRKPGAARWVTTNTGEAQYNQNLPASLFTPNFPQSAQLIDSISGREHWRQRLAAGVASQLVGHFLQCDHLSNPNDPYHPATSGEPTRRRGLWSVTSRSIRGATCSYCSQPTTRSAWERQRTVRGELTDDIWHKVRQLYFSEAFQVCLCSDQLGIRYRQQQNERIFVQQ